jgi:hypothetical protein
VLFKDLITVFFQEPLETRKHRVWRKEERLNVTAGGYIIKTWLDKEESRLENK